MSSNKSNADRKCRWDQFPNDLANVTKEELAKGQELSDKAKKASLSSNSPARSDFSSSNEDDSRNSPFCDRTQKSPKRVKLIRPVSTQAKKILVSSPSTPITAQNVPGPALSSISAQPSPKSFANSSTLKSNSDEKGSKVNEDINFKEVFSKQTLEEIEKLKLQEMENEQRGTSTPKRPKIIRPSFANKDVKPTSTPTVSEKDTKVSPTLTGDKKITKIERPSVIQIENKSTNPNLADDRTKNTNNESNKGVGNKEAVASTSLVEDSTKNEPVKNISEGSEPVKSIELVPSKSPEKTSAVPAPVKSISEVPSKSPQKSSAVPAPVESISELPSKSPQKCSEVPAPTKIISEVVPSKSPQKSSGIPAPLKSISELPSKSPQKSSEVPAPTKIISAVSLSKSPQKTSGIPAPLKSSEVVPSKSPQKTSAVPAPVESISELPSKSSQKSSEVPAPTKVITEVLPSKSPQKASEVPAQIKGNSKVLPKSTKNISEVPKPIKSIPEASESLQKASSEVPAQIKSVSKVPSYSTKNTTGVLAPEVPSEPLKTISEASLVDVSKPQALLKPCERIQETVSSDKPEVKELPPETTKLPQVIQSENKVKNVITPNISTAEDISKNVMSDIKSEVIFDDSDGRDSPRIVLKITKKTDKCEITKPSSSNVDCKKVVTTGVSDGDDIAISTNQSYMETHRDKKPTAKNKEADSKQLKNIKESENTTVVKENVKLKIEEQCEPNLSQDVLESLEKNLVGEKSISEPGNIKNEVDKNKVESFPKTSSIENEEKQLKDDAASDSNARGSRKQVKTVTKKENKTSEPLNLIKDEKNEGSMNEQKESECIVKKEVSDNSTDVKTSVSESSVIKETSLENPNENSIETADKDQTDDDEMSNKTSGKESSAEKGKKKIPGLYPIKISNQKSPYGEPDGKSSIQGMLKMRDQLEQQMSTEENPESSLLAKLLINPTIKGSRVSEDESNVTTSVSESPDDAKQKQRAITSVFRNVFTDKRKKPMATSTPLKKPKDDLVDLNQPSGSKQSLVQIDGNSTIDKQTEKLSKNKSGKRTISTRSRQLSEEEEGVSEKPTTSCRRKQKLPKRAERENNVQNLERLKLLPQEQLLQYVTDGRANTEESTSIGGKRKKEDIPETPAMKKKRSKAKSPKSDESFNPLDLKGNLSVKLPLLESSMDVENPINLSTASINKLHVKPPSSLSIELVEHGKYTETDRKREESEKVQPLKLKLNKSSNVTIQPIPSNYADSRGIQISPVKSPGSCPSGERRKSKNEENPSRYIEQAASSWAAPDILRMERLLKESNITITPVPPSAPKETSSLPLALLQQLQQQQQLKRAPHQQQETFEQQLHKMHPYFQQQQLQMQQSQLYYQQHMQQPYQAKSGQKNAKTPENEEHSQPRKSNKRGKTPPVSSAKAVDVKSEIRKKIASTSAVKKSVDEAPEAVSESPPKKSDACKTSPEQLITAAEKSKTIPEIPKVSTDKPKTTPETPSTLTEKPKTSPHKPSTPIEKRKASTDKPKTPPEKPNTPIDKRKASTEKPKTSPEKANTPAEKRKASTDKSKTSPEIPEISTQKTKTPTEKVITPSSSPVLEDSKEKEKDKETDEHDSSEVDENISTPKDESKAELTVESISAVMAMNPFRGTGRRGRPPKALVLAREAYNRQAMQGKIMENSEDNLKLLDQSYSSRSGNNSDDERRGRGSSRGRGSRGRSFSLRTGKRGRPRLSAEDDRYDEDLLDPVLDMEEIKLIEEERQRREEEKLRKIEMRKQKYRERNELVRQKRIKQKMRQEERKKQWHEKKRKMQEEKLKLQEEISKLPPQPSNLDEDTRMSADNGTSFNFSTAGMVEDESCSGTNDSQLNNKKGRMDFGDASKDLTAEQIAEYQWPIQGGELYMIQEQISNYLGVKSFKRKYPAIKRRQVDMEERAYLVDSGLVSETLCELGLTAVYSSELLDIMFTDFPEKYEELRKHMREKQAMELSFKQKAWANGLGYKLLMAEGGKQDMKKRAMESASNWNSALNKSRKEERKCAMDLQTFIVHYPQSRSKSTTINSSPKIGSYPLSLLPGQYCDYYEKFSSNELRYLPLNTVMYGPLKKPSVDVASSIASQSDSEDSSSSDEASSTASEETVQLAEEVGDDEDVKCKEEPMEIEIIKEDAKCSVCGDANKSKEYLAEPLIHCSKCKTTSHPSCVGLTVDMVRYIEKYDWLCAGCKTCIQCSDPVDTDKLINCDLCDRGYHIYCIGLRKTPVASWHCQACIMCDSCGAKEPGENSIWTFEVRKCGKTRKGIPLCAVCIKLYRRGTYCPICFRCHSIRPNNQAKYIQCYSCEKWIHPECMPEYVDNPQEYICDTCDDATAMERAMNRSNKIPT